MTRKMTKMDRGVRKRGAVGTGAFCRRVAVLLALLSLSVTVAGQTCPPSGTVSRTFDHGDFNGRVEAMVWGDLGAGLRLYAGGDFTMAGGAPARYLAEFDGVRWRQVGNGIDFVPSDLGFHGGRLVVAVPWWVSQQDGVFNLGAWDGSSWTGFGNTSGVRTIASENGDLFVGGSFQSIDGVSAANCAMYRNGSWSPLGAGVTDPVLDVVAFQGGIAVSLLNYSNPRVLRWSGQAWSDLQGILSFPASLEVHGGQLHAGANSMVARLGTVGWSILASGVSGGVREMLSYRGSLYVSAGIGPSDGWLYRISGAGLQQIAQANGMIYCMAGDPTPGVAAIAFGGHFTSTDNTEMSMVGRLSLSPMALSALGSGHAGQAPTGGTSSGGAVFCAATVQPSPGADRTLFVAGTFRAVGDERAGGLAVLEADGLSAVPGLEPGSAITATFEANGTLYVGGRLQLSSGPVVSVAAWNGVSWTALGGLISGAIVRAIREYGGRLYAGTTVGLRVLSGSVWSDVGALDGRVDALAEFGGRLVVGGTFSIAGAVPNTSLIAGYDGSNWFELDGGMVGSAVTDLDVWQGDLFVCGTFSAAGPVAANNVAYMPGVLWTALGQGVPPNPQCIKVLGPASAREVYVGGYNGSGSHLYRYVPAQAWSEVASGEGVINDFSCLDPDGPGPIAEQLVLVGPHFIGSHFTGGVAMWSTDDSAWSDLGGASSGATGDPLLVGSGPLTAGSTISLQLSNSLANTITVLGVAVGSTTPTAFSNGTLHVNPAVLALTYPVGPSGDLSVSLVAPPGLPCGLRMVFQHVVLDSGASLFALSNGVRALTR